MHTRLRDPSDEDAIVDLARQDLEENNPHLRFDDGAARATFLASFHSVNPTICVLEAEGEVVGFFLSSVSWMGFTKAVYVVLEVMYIAPKWRTADAERLLLEEFDLRAQQVNAAEVYFAAPARSHTGAFESFADKQGFTQVGKLMRRAGVPAHVC